MSNKNCGSSDFASLKTQCVTDSILVLVPSAVARSMFHKPGTKHLMAGSVLRRARREASVTSFLTSTASVVPDVTGVSE